MLFIGVKNCTFRRQLSAMNCSSVAATMIVVRYVCTYLHEKALALFHVQQLNDVWHMIFTSLEIYRITVLFLIVLT